MMRMLTRTLFFLLCFGLPRLTPAQTLCAEPVTVPAVSQPNRIEWGKFPAFSLPFPVIYGGPRFGDNQALPLRHGFSHIVQLMPGEYGTVIKAGQRAVEYSGFATGLSQPWETLESPWNNDLTAYRRKWDQWLSDVAGGQTNATGKYVFQGNRLVLDIERIAETDARILALKTNPAVPVQYRQLGDGAFISAYKNAIRNLYAEGARYVRQRADLTGVLVGSYSDVPIRNTYLNVPANTWTDWTTNLSRVHYLVKDSTEQRVGGPFYDQIDTQTPSVYYYYDYPSGLAPDYLAYTLFQIEANRAWSGKPVVPYVWLRYHDTSATPYGFIRPFMAEATAIFPVFSGAAGLWLWEDPGVERSRTENYAVYESFVQGLYRLSRFADMFQGQYELVIETPARDLMAKQLPVWRGVVKNDKILIAAHNPYATETGTTRLTVRYKTWQRELTLTGREVLLCRYELNAVTATEPAGSALSVGPNPARTEVVFRWQQPAPALVLLTVSDLAGRVVRHLSVPVPAGAVVQRLSVAGLSAGVYLWQLEQDKHRQSGRLVLE
jgi:hypothetical protein